MGRKRLWADSALVKFEAHTFDRLAAVLQEGETRSDLIRSATMAELQRREAERIASPAPSARRRKGDVVD